MAHSFRDKLDSVGMMRFGVPVGGMIGKVLGDAATVVGPAFPRQALTTTATEVLHMTWVDMWVEALVRGEEWLTSEDLAFDLKQWRLGGGFPNVLPKDPGTRFGMIWVADSDDEVMARYLKPTAQDFWLRVE